MSRTSRECLQNGVRPGENLCVIPGAEGSRGEQGDEGEGLRDVEVDGEEEAEVKPVAKPVAPSKAERDKHEMTHAEYRSWCSHCVRGRGQEFPHQKDSREKNPMETPEILMDYCYPSQEDENAAIILGIRCRQTGARQHRM